MSSCSTTWPTWGRRRSLPSSASPKGRSSHGCRGPRPDSPHCSRTGRSPAMSELDVLRTLGDRLVPPSLDDLRETARRRTRRTVTAAAVVAAAAVTAVVGVTQLELTEHDSAPPPPTNRLVPDGSRPLIYADGATVHYGDQSVTAPGRVVELDPTDEGVSFRTADDRIWFTDGSEPEQ